MEPLIVEHDSINGSWRKALLQHGIPSKVCKVIHSTTILFATVSITLASWWNGMSIVYTWHVLLSGVGVHLFMSIGISLMRGTKRYGRDSTCFTPKTFHWMVQSVASACILIGSILQYINRETKHKRHIDSAHSIAGLISVVSIVVGLSTGVATMFGWELRKYLRPVWCRRMHRTVGLVAFSTGMLALLLAYDKQIFNERFSSNMRLALMSANVATTMISSFGVFKKMYYYFYGKFSSRNDNKEIVAGDGE